MNLENNDISQEQYDHILGITDAIKQLRPNCNYELVNTTFTKWDDRDGLPPPAWEDVVERMKLNAEIFEKTQYMRDRRSEFKKLDSPEDQLDNIWHKINNGEVIDSSSEWFTTIKKIKEDFPKPKEE